MCSLKGNLKPLEQYENRRWANWSQQGICLVNHLMTLMGAFIRLKARFKMPAQQIPQGQQHAKRVAIIQSTMPIKDRRKATNMKGRPMRNPSGRQSQPSSSLILTTPTISPNSHPPNPTTNCTSSNSTIRAATGLKKQSRETPADDTHSLVPSFNK